MGDGFQYIDIILLAMVAGFIALRLRSVLGKRTGNEKTSEEKSGAGRADSARPESVDEAHARVRNQAAAAGEEGTPSWTVGIDVDSALGKTLSRIKVADRNFDPDQFVQGAREAYRMIVEAFASGDRETLQSLLAPEIYRDFETAIKDRHERGETMETRVVDIDEARILDASLEDKHAELTLKFVASCMTITRDAENRIIAGNPSDAEVVTDVWTFARNVTSADPNWLLIATDSGE